MNIDAEQLVFTPGRECTLCCQKNVHVYIFLTTIYREKIVICLVDIEKAFDEVPGIVMKWTMRKKGLSEGIARTVMDLYQGTKTNVRAG